MWEVPHFPTFPPTYALISTLARDYLRRADEVERLEEWSVTMKKDGKKDTLMNEPYDQPDEAGLYPIHWAAIYNRPDKIESMLDNGSPLKIKCSNKLFAHGTALHLAATNGSIEAAAILFYRWLRQTETVPKSLTIEESKTDLNQTSWLQERDSEGQTPLMRSAAPRSKRMSTIRDLLRKNLWSLGARPAEMALFLISLGADWRETDTVFGMNLLHLAIVNNHDDIVYMLIVVDKQLVSIAAHITKTENWHATSKKGTEFVTINITSEADDNSDEVQPLIDVHKLRRETAKNLVASGLLPLQLAIVYGRSAIISLLWQAEFELKMAEPMSINGENRKLTRKVLASSKKLKATLVRVFWSSQEEVVKFIRVAAYKVALIVDLTVLVLLWMPTYLHRQDLAVFVISSGLTLALALRVIFKDPGYLARESQNYYEEIANIVHGIKEQPKTETNSLNHYMLMRKRVRMLCHKCRCIRTSRSRHCNYCARCVQDFDHHCIYLGCCIGRYNRLDFLLMLMLLTITAIYGTIAMDCKTHDSRSHFWHIINGMWIAKYILIGAISVFLNLRRACLGVTMYEELRSKRIRATKDPIRRNQMIEDTYWRYTPNRFLTGDLSAKAIMMNLGEFSNINSSNDLFLTMLNTDLLLPFNDR